MKIQISAKHSMCRSVHICIHMLASVCVFMYKVLIRPSCCIICSMYTHICTYIYIFIWYPPPPVPYLPSHLFAVRCCPKTFPSLCCQVLSQNLPISLLSSAVPKPSHLFAVRCCSTRKPPQKKRRTSPPNKNSQQKN